MNAQAYLQFIKRSPPVTLIGVIGDEGKTTTAYLIYEFLTSSYPPPKEEPREAPEPAQVVFSDKPSAFLLKAEDNVDELLKRIKREDIVIVELDENLLRSLDEAGIAMQIVVCTNILPMSHSKETRQLALHALALKRQSSNNFFITGEEALATLKSVAGFGIKSKVVVKTAEDVPRSWTTQFVGYHNRENIAKALAVAEIFKMGHEALQALLAQIQTLPGRLQKIKRIRGIDIYNDALSKTPAATLAALRALASHKNVTLILGGKDIGYDVSCVVPYIGEYCTSVVLLAGTGTHKIQKNILALGGVTHAYAETYEEAIEKGLDISRPGDILLFSPGFGTTSEEDRSENFVRALENLV